ncbi:Protein QNS-1 b [Aphelenchoides avenae]|nr:Protein QNS-1 b [Aphelenchus avenae]
MPWDRRVNVAVCTVNQWSLDFRGNTDRIIKTCREAYERGARIRLGPELEICGYGCMDHFFEMDTEWHSWECLREIVEESKKLKDLVIITGLPVRFKVGLYNCLATVCNGRLVYLYPKGSLCDDDIYRETRYFVPWRRGREVIEYSLDPEFGFEQKTVPFGGGFIESADGIKIGFELCEELWTAKSPSVDLALAGVDIICNASGSHHVLGKSHTRINKLVIGATIKAGFFLPLSGGQDSCSVALMVRLMCEKVCQAVRENPDKDDPAYYFQGEKVGTDPAELCSRLLYTCYMGSENSSKMTKDCADGLAKDIGSNHSSIFIDAAVSAFLGIFKASFNFVLSFASSDYREGLALQNVQARIRMVLAYLYAQASLVYYKRSGGLLVLGTSNVDESLVGYVTKYDCSSADINPIGSISKHDLREFLRYVNQGHDFPHLQPVIDSIPTAELRPLVEGEVVQTDEDEIGLTYEELSVLGRLRRPGCHGPYGMFLAVLPIWSDKYTVEQIGEKVIRFCRRYAINRHKATVATPAYHANRYSNDDHRNDHRPFLYPNLEFQYQRIRDKVAELNAAEKQ